ncbi:MAG: hypothetical protein H7256_09805 [Bdellovibrio sp.]|nr:hypothetical protein [Bdellovibrio sp.]
MKNVLASLVLLTGSMSMAAGSLYIDGRVDHKSYSPNDAVGTPGSETFQISRLKIDYQGKLSDANSFRVRLDTLKNTTATNASGNTSAFMDLAYVAHKFTDEVSLTMGRYVSGMGGVEGFINSPADIYLRSVAGDETATIYQPVGAQVNLTFGDHKVNLNFANNTEDASKAVSSTVTGNAGGFTAPATTTTYPTQTRSLMGVSYTAKLMDATLIPVASYHFEDYASARGGNSRLKNTFINAGARYLIGDFEIEADYLSNKYDYDTQAAQVLSTISAVGLVRYKLNDVGSFHLKYEGTDQKLATSATSDTKNKITGLTAAFEYKPAKDENWRMHLAFAQKDNKPDSGDTRTEKIVYAGMRFYGDLLK